MNRKFFLLTMVSGMATSLTAAFAATKQNETIKIKFDKYVYEHKDFEFLLFYKGKSTGFRGAYGFVSVSPLGQIFQKNNIVYECISVKALEKQLLPYPSKTYYITTYELELKPID